MDIYISSLDNWIENSSFCKHNAIYFAPIDECIDLTKAKSNWKETMSKFKINTSKPIHKEFLNKVEGIEHIEIDFVNAFNPKLKWK